MADAAAAAHAVYESGWLALAKHEGTISTIDIPWPCQEESQASGMSRPFFLFLFYLLYHTTHTTKSERRAEKQRERRGASSGQKTKGGIEGEVATVK